MDHLIPICLCGAVQRGNITRCFKAFGPPGSEKLTSTLDLSARSWISRMQDCWRSCTVKLLVQPAISNRKLRSISMPRTVRSTSGWNWVPYSFFCSLAMPAGIIESEAQQGYYSDFSIKLQKWLWASLIFLNICRQIQLLVDLFFLKFFIMWQICAYPWSPICNRTTSDVRIHPSMINPVMRFSPFCSVLDSRDLIPDCIRDGSIHLNTCNDISWLGNHFEPVSHLVNTVTVRQKYQLLFLQTPVEDHQTGSQKALRQSTVRSPWNHSQPLWINNYAEVKCLTLPGEVTYLRRHAGYERPA